jgi:hypothetical protein
VVSGFLLFPLPRYSQRLKKLPLILESTGLGVGRPHFDANFCNSAKILAKEIGEDALSTESAWHVSSQS